MERIINGKNGEKWSLMTSHMGRMSLRIHEWGPDVAKLPLPIGNLGGGMYDLPSRLNLNADHYNQADTSENETLWDLCDGDNFTHEISWSGSLRIDEELWRRAHNTDPSNRDVARTAYEHIQIARKTHYAEAAEAWLATVVNGSWDDGEILSEVTGSELQLPDDYHSGWRPLDEGPESLVVEPLTEVIQRVDTKQEHLSAALRDGANPAVVAHEYTKLLLELHPWFASPLLFSNEEVFSFGIAQLELELWGQLGRAALLASRMTLSTQWAQICLWTVEVITEMRHATFSALSTAYFIAHECQAISCNDSPNPTAIHHYDTLAKHPGVDAVNSYILGHTFRLAGQANLRAWAHKDCQDRHVCNVQQPLACRIMFSELGADAIGLPSGPEGPLMVEYDPTVNDD